MADSPEDSLDLDEIGEQSLWVLTGKKGGGKEALLSLHGSRNQRVKLELESLRRENEELKKQAVTAKEDRDEELRRKEKQIASLEQQLEVCDHSSIVTMCGD